MNQYLKEAQEMAREVVAIEAKDGRDIGAAMRNAARRHGIPFGALWALRYRPPKDILAGVYFSIRKAHEATLEQQRKKL